MNIIKVPVKSIRKGDVFNYKGARIWEALGDAAPDARGVIQLRVCFLTDGGRDMRLWDDPDHLLPIERADA